MDNITHEIRLANWKTVVEQCQSRPKGQTIAKWCEQNEISVKQYYYWQRRVRRQAVNDAAVLLPAPATASGDDPISFTEIPVPQSLPVAPENDLLADFHPEAVIHRGDITIGLRNSISDRLLEGILKGVSYAG